MFHPLVQFSKVSMPYTAAQSEAFRRSSKVSRSPIVRELLEDGRSPGSSSTPLPKRTQDPASPTSSHRTTPANRSAASEEAASLQDLQELGKLLQEVSTKMMDKTTRHITVSTRELFSKMKALHASILAASRAAAAGAKERQESEVWTSLCPKCAQSTRSADKEQQTTTVGKQEATAQKEPWRRLRQPNWPELPAPVRCPRRHTPPSSRTPQSPLVNGGCGTCVFKVRRTNNGNLLLEVAKGSVESAEDMKESIERGAR
nr:transcription initiation factor TFIID subunit 12-like [Drosophila kikkawai]